MNSIFGIGPLELFFIAIIALVILGPERLPGVIREGMKYYRTLRNMSGDLTSQFSEELKALDDINPQKIMNEMMQDLDMEEERKALAELNPKKIRKDIADSMNPLKTTAKKPAVASTVEADATAASAAAAAGAVAVADADDPAAPEEPAQPPVEETAEETAKKTDVVAPPVSEKDDNRDAPVKDTVEDKAAPAVLTTAEILARSQPKKMSSSPYAKSSKSSKKAVEGDTTSPIAPAASSSSQSKAPDLNSQDLDEPEVENRIAPDKLAANLDTATPADPTDPTAVSANGTPEETHEETRDSVEDGA